MYELPRYAKWSTFSSVMPSKSIAASGCAGCKITVVVFVALLERCSILYEPVKTLACSGDRSPCGRQQHIH